MKKKISFFQRKGGVGKSTATITISSILAEKGYKVLVVDLDVQRNTTRSIGAKQMPKLTIADLMMDPYGLDVFDAITETNNDNLHVLVSSKELDNIDSDLFKAFDREKILKKLLEKVEDSYDFILLDLPPALNIYTINALTASDHLVIPLIPDTYCLEGFLELIDFERLIKKALNPNLNELGVFFNICDSRTQVAKEFMNEISRVYPDVFNTFIRKNEAVKKAQKARIPLPEYDKDSNAYIDFLALTDEILTKLNTK